MSVKIKKQFLFFKKKIMTKELLKIFAMEKFSKENLDKLNFPSYYRRKDIDQKTRIIIGLEALRLTPKRGQIKELEDTYNISRPFIYTLRDTLIQLLLMLALNQSPKIVGYIKEEERRIEKKDLIDTILYLRLEGGCTLSSISILLKHLEYEVNSPSYVSELLTGIGSLLDSTIEILDAKDYIYIYVSDEIFSNNIPILVTVCAVSGAILNIKLSEKRDKISWTKHWQKLKSKGITPLLICSDQGSGMLSAYKELFGDVLYQPDLYHFVGHALGKYLGVLERQAYSAIKEEYHRETVALNRQTDESFNKEVLKYEAACEKAEKAIYLYDSFTFLYGCLLEEFELFDEKEEVNNAQDALENFEVALCTLQELIKEDYPSIKKTLDKMKKSLTIDIFNFLFLTQEICNNLLKDCQEDEKQVLKYIFKSYEFRKKSLKSKNYAQKKHYRKEEANFLEFAKTAFDTLAHDRPQRQINKDFLELKTFVYHQLSYIVCGSGLVENINSKLRVFLNQTKNNTTQAKLNLWAFHHNHSPYRSGLRKGFSPFEILTRTINTNNDTDEWLNILKQRVAEKLNVNASTQEVKIPQRIRVWAKVG